MLATRLTVLRPALRTLLRPKTTKAKDMVDPTTTSAWWKEWAGQNHQGFFNVGAAFFLTVLASQNYSGRLERAALQADLAAAQTRPRRGARAPPTTPRSRTPRSASG